MDKLSTEDETRFAAIAAAVDATIADLTGRLDQARRTRGGSGRQALDRDQEIHRLTARLRVLRRFGRDLCLGRFVTEDGETVYVGRIGLAGPDGERLLVDWRSPAAEPFFAATQAHRMGLVSRRRYRWTDGKVSDQWDEDFATGGLDDPFIASLGGLRSDRMRDVLGTIQADQDAIIRAGSRGALVVDGGPGTGKTVVALHRAAYLLYADPRLGHRRGGVLFVGPSRPYLAYVGDVLPSLGEEGVRTCTLGDLLPDLAGAPAETDPAVARLKSTAALVGALEPAVRFYEDPPTDELLVETPWSEVTVTAGDWAAAFAAPDPGTPHNEAREAVREELVGILLGKHADPDDEDIRRALLRHRELRRALDDAWPMLDAAELVGDLWTVPAYLRLCAPWLEREEVAVLQRADAQAWTAEDVPLLDAARRRLGDATAAARRARREAALAAERREMDAVVEHLIATDDSELQVMSMLRGADLQGALVPAEATERDPDELAGPFAHVVVDEAQELTDAQWQQLLARCPSHSFTIAGDRAQARRGFAEPWTDRLTRVGFERVEQAGLTINYRTPREVMAEAEPVIRAVLPDANVPTSVRDNGLPVLRRPVSELETIVSSWLAAHEEGTVCVIATAEVAVPDSARVRVLTPELAKGLEFDLVVLVEPASYGDGVEGAVDRYVAMTRATQQLVLLGRPGPDLT
ncbi:MAG: AAA family ATPase [Nocardioidaceae bacterium]|nr:AAA family ATPase [Nocardioidaceae bacterium]